MTDLNLPSAPQRLCVVRLSAIGDTCHALAVVRRLQDNWPETRLTWIIGKTEAALMADIPGIEFIIFDKSRGRIAYKDIANALGDAHFDIALCMHASMRANFIYRQVSADIKLGFDRARARDLQWLFTNRRIATTAGQHALDAMMSFATAIGAKERTLRWDIPVNDNASSFASRFRHDKQPLVAISPCSSQRSRNFRNWRVERYAAVVQHLMHCGCRIVITGGNSAIEKEYGEILSQNRATENLVGTTSLKELLALFAEADLVICPDSGPAHMANAVATPVLGLYATSNPERTGPYLSRDLTVNRYPDAARRFLGKDGDELRWGQRVRHPDAMDLITVEDVTERIDVQLGR